MRSKGYTLVEILVVVAILSVLAAVATPMFLTYRKSSQAKACDANLRMLNNASQSAILRDNLADNATITIDMLKPSEKQDRSHAFLRNAPVCPNGGKYVYDTKTQKWSCQDGNHD